MDKLRVRKLKAKNEMLKKELKFVKGAYIQALEVSIYWEDQFKEVLNFIDGERIVSADTIFEQLNGQGRNQAYDIIEKYIKSKILG